MEFKMTERDKKLLILLALVLIVIGFIVFLLMPAIEKRRELNLSIEEAQIQQDKMATAIASYPLQQEEYKSLKARGKEVLEEYYPIMANQEIDRIITGAVVSFQAEAVSLNIQVAEESPQLKPYFASGSNLPQEEILQTDGEEPSAVTEMNPEEMAEMGASEETGGEGEGNTISSSTLRKASISLTVRGERNTLHALLDYFFNNCPGILVKSYSISDPLSDALEKKQPLAAIEMELYMCDKESLQ